MGRIVIACYKPHPGQESRLQRLLATHVDRLRKEGLATHRESIVMKSSSGTFIEVFEWESKEAIEAAHHNPAVQKMWEEFSAVCEYETPMNIQEFSQLFSEFTPVN